jgi:hypothetical protein
MMTDPIKAHRQTLRRIRAAEIAEQQPKKAPFPGWRTMTRAQRYNAKMDRIWEAAKDAKTQFNESSRTEQPTDI